MSNNTDINEFFGDLDGGSFQSKVERMLSDVAAATIDNTGKKGKVSIEFGISRIGNSGQVNIDHKLSYVRPTENGKVNEEYTTSTPMYVGTGGRLTFFPENQGQLLTKTGEINTNNEGA